MNRETILKIRGEILKKPSLSFDKKMEIVFRTDRLLSHRGEETISVWWWLAHQKPFDPKNSFIGKIIKPIRPNIGDITQVDSSHLGIGMSEMIASQQGRGHLGNDTKH